MDITQILRYAHDGFRWVVLIAALVALAINIYAFFAHRASDGKAVKNSMRFWTISMDIQWLLGLLLIIFQYVRFLGIANTPATAWEHAIGNTLAVAVAHAYMAFRKRPGRTPLVGNIATILIALVILVASVAVVAGWS